MRTQLTISPTKVGAITATQSHWDILLSPPKGDVSRQWCVPRLRQKYLLWCRDVLVELGYPQDPIPIMEDNKSCITMLQQEPRNFHTKSRHVRVKWAFFRQEYAKRTIFLRYCPTASMVADLLTKPLGSRAHNLLSTSILNGSEP